jgi:hypothetical protein
LFFAAAPIVNAPPAPAAVPAIIPTLWNMATGDLGTLASFSASALVTKLPFLSINPTLFVGLFVLSRKCWYLSLS